MENRLPNGWVLSAVGDLARYVNGRAFKPNEWKTSGKPIIRIQNLNNSEAVYNYSDEDHEEKYVVTHGDLLFAWSASLGAHVWKGGDAWLNQHIFNVLPFSGVNKSYLFYLLSKITAELYAKAHGSGMVHVTKGKFEETEVYLPPTEEQKRIVAKIEELFSELDKGIESLQTAREQLKVYRQAVLKHAFEGKLTEQWRKDNADKLESPEQLLARIQQERDARYQQQLEDWKAAVKEWEANGKEGKKPGKPKEFLRQGEVDSGSQLVFDIPDEWKFELIGNIFSVHVGATPSRKNNQFWNGDISWVSSGEVAFGEIHATNETITHAGYENTSTEIHPEGTVLLAMIGEGKTRGQAAILRTSAAHNQNTAAVRVSEVGLPPEYIYYFLLYQYEQTRRVGSGNNQKALNKNRVASIQFPLCSAEEQIAVVQALSEKLFSIESVNQELEIQLTKAETLRQSILKKAFSGQLVPQDPNDEPASELLARIQAEKAALSAKAKKTPAKRARKAKEVSE